MEVHIMNTKFLIKPTALKLLEQLYINCNHELQATIDVSKLLNDDVDIKTIQKACRYLIQKKMISTQQIPCDKWTAAITSEGIDWVEDANN